MSNETGASFERNNYSPRAARVPYYTNTTTTTLVALSLIFDELLAISSIAILAALSSLHGSISPNFSQLVAAR